MGLRVVGIRVSITRFVSDEPQPGLVECEFADARGARWTFTLKTAYVSAEPLDASSGYPRPGAIGCEVVGRRRHPAGGEVVEVTTDCFPDGAEPDGDRMRFEVPPDALVEWEWGSAAERPWAG